MPAAVYLLSWHDRYRECGLSSQHHGSRNISLFAAKRRARVFPIPPYPYIRKDIQVISRSLIPGKPRMGNTGLCRKRHTDRETQFGSAPVSVRAKARQTFVTAVRRVIHLLKLRRKWAAYGRILQEFPRRDLWVGLSRSAGVLHRRFPASATGSYGENRKSRGVLAPNTAVPHPRPVRKDRYRDRDLFRVD